MKKLVIILSILISVNAFTQRSEFRIATDTTLLLISDGKDTSIADTMALIRYLLAEQKRSYDELKYYRQQLYKTEASMDFLMESIGGIMFYQPKQKRNFKL